MFQPRQMSANIDTVEFYAAFADAVVLSRELSLRQVANTVNEIGRRQITGRRSLVKIEVFAHGALCMAISGKCYLSLHSHNSLGQPGRLHPELRKQYVVTDKENGAEPEIDNEYIVSAKDLCTIGFLDRIVAAGVGILKIESSARPPAWPVALLPQHGPAGNDHPTVTIPVIIVASALISGVTPVFTFEKITMGRVLAGRR